MRVFYIQGDFVRFSIDCDISIHAITKGKQNLKNSEKL